MLQLHGAHCSDVRRSPFSTHYFFSLGLNDGKNKNETKLKINIRVKWIEKRFFLFHFQFLTVSFLFFPHKIVSVRIFSPIGYRLAQMTRKTAYMGTQIFNSMENLAKFIKKLEKFEIMFQSNRTNFCFEILTSYS